MKKCLLLLMLACVLFPMYGCDTQEDPPEPLHNRSKVNGHVYSNEWVKTTFFGSISLDSFFLDGSDNRINHRTEFELRKGNRISGTFRTNKFDEGMQYLVSLGALSNFRRAGVDTIVMKNGSEYRDPQYSIDVIAVLASLDNLTQSQRDDIRYLLFMDKDMESDALYIDFEGNVKNMDGTVVRTYSTDTLDTFPDFGRLK